MQARVAGKLWRPFFVALFGWLLCGADVNAAELTLADIKVQPGHHGLVVVSGSIDGESSYGVTIMLELVPRPGSSGTLEFTPVLVKAPAKRSSFSIHRKDGRLEEVRVVRQTQPEIDVVQLGDAWPGQGTFSVFDTDQTNSRSLNGAIDDNGTFVRAPVTFSGLLAALPLKASPAAEGVWDVMLSTSKGDSGWEGVATQLESATVTVSLDACDKNRDCNDGDPCTDDTCEAGMCRHTHREDRCSEWIRRESRVRSQDSATGTQNERSLPDGR